MNENGVKKVEKIEYTSASAAESTSVNVRLRVLTALLALAMLFSLAFSAVSSAAGAVTSASVDHTSYSFGSSPAALNVTFYTDMRSRGFAWFTDTSNDSTELYIVAGKGGENADFTAAELIEGECTEITVSGESVNSHKAHVTGLEYGASYSYKLGGDGEYVCGVFTVDSESPRSVTVLNFNSAQTKDPDKLYVWENTVAQALTKVPTADMVIYGGDQFDTGMIAGGGDKSQSSIARIVRYGIARDTVASYVRSIPYFSVAGTQEYNTPNAHANYSDIDYAGSAASGAYYSFDYGSAHFVMLNSNLTGDALASQIAWLREDLAAASAADSATNWIIVTMDNGPYSTGSRSDDAATRAIVTEYTPVFSEFHVDLVLQAHDRVYTKTLPYKWDSAGYTVTYGNAEVVNFEVRQTEQNGVTYDLNPNGTYYISCGAAGHRAGESEASDGVWADLDLTGYDPAATVNSMLDGLSANATFTDNNYKIEVDRITKSNSYGEFTFTKSGEELTNAQVFNEGDPATGNVNAQMFGVLTVTADTLKYNFYTVEGGEVKLFDTLYVLKSEQSAEYEDKLAELPDFASATPEELIALAMEFIDTPEAFASLSESGKAKVRELMAIPEVVTEIEAGIEAVINEQNAEKEVKFVSLQTSAPADGVFNARLVAGLYDRTLNIDSVGFDICVYNAEIGEYGKVNRRMCLELYSETLTADEEHGFINEKSVSEIESCKGLCAITLTDIPAEGTVTIKVTPFGKNDTQTVFGTAYRITFVDGIAEVEACGG